MRKWTLTKSRHRKALVFALSGCLHDSSNRYAQSVRGWTVTLGFGLWSFHVAYRKEARDDG